MAYKRKTSRKTKRKTSRKTSRKKTKHRTSRRTLRRSTKRKTSRKTSRKILSNLMKKKIGRKVEILFESNKKSYTDDYYKVSLIGEKAQLNMKKAIGSVISVRVVSKKNDRLMAEI